MNKATVLLILILVSCSSKWKRTPVNKFLAQSIIDTTKYNTYEELFSSGKIKMITTSDSLENYTHFSTPLISNDQYIFIEKKYYPNRNKNVIVKIDKNGVTVDSIIIDKGAAIINDYIITKNSYSTWFINDDRNMKDLENINFFQNRIQLKSKDL